MTGITAIVHMYNEAYLLPFWIEHHRPFFDHVIFIDYRSTDESVELIRKLAPTWEVRTTKTTAWIAKHDDDEVMEIERTLPGFKIALNMTDFFVPNVPIPELLRGGPVQKLHVFVVSSDAPSESPETVSALLSGITRAAPDRRGFRILHSHEDGNYKLGRHDTYLGCVWSNAQVFWLGFYPWNERMIARKRQLAGQVTKQDTDIGAGVHHHWSVEELERRHKELPATLRPLSDFSAFQGAIRKLLTLQE